MSDTTITVTLPTDYVEFLNMFGALNHMTIQGALALIVKTRMDETRALTQRPAAQTDQQWQETAAALNHYAHNGKWPDERPAGQTKREADGLSLIVAGAIFDFAGFMTTRSEVIEVGSTAEAGPVADLVKEWAELRGLNLADAAVLSWQLHITRASLPAPQQATPEPLTSFDDPKAQIVYDLLCSDEAPPPEQHWEGWVARRIVDALAATPEPSPAAKMLKADVAYVEQQMHAATPEPVGEPWGWAIEDKHGVAQAIRPARKEFFGCVQSTDPFTAEDIAKMDREWSGIAPHHVVTLYPRPAPGVPEGLIEYLRHVRETFANGPMANVPQVRGQIIALDVWIDALAAAQAKGGV